MARHVFTKNAKFNWTNYPIIYLIIYKFLGEKVASFNPQAMHYNQEISTKLMFEVWHRTVYHIPKYYDFYFLEEFDYFKFIKKLQAQRCIFYGRKMPNVELRLDVEKGGDGGAYESDKIQEAPLLYLLFFENMIKTFGRENRTVTGKQIINTWRPFIPNIARIYDKHILIEMCNYGFIRKDNDQRYIFYGAKGITKLRRLNNLRLW